MSRSGGQRRAPDLGWLLEGGKRILPEESVALGDRGSELETQHLRGAGFPCGVCGSACTLPGALGVGGTTKRISLAGAVAGQRPKGMSQ